MSQVAILGTGAWATALANVLLENGHSVNMWGIDTQEVSSLKKGTNPKYFGNKKLFKKVDLVSLDINEIIKCKPSFILLAIPSNFIIQTLKLFIKKLDFQPVIINVAKGLDQKTNDVWSKSIKSLVKNNVRGVVTLIGPSFANEVIHDQPTMLNAVSANINQAKEVARLFNNSHFKCIEIVDEVGAEIMGALKNVMAIAMGIAYELHTSINTRAAMLAQATKEIFNIVKLYGGKSETLMQFCGVGDIYLTCTDEKSRNFSFGKQIAHVGLAKALENNEHKTVEGYRTAKIIYQVIQKNHISSPVFSELYQVLFNRHSIKDFVKNVMVEIIE